MLQVCDEGLRALPQVEDEKRRSLQCYEYHLHRGRKCQECGCQVKHIREGCEYENKLFLRTA